MWKKIFILLAVILGIYLTFGVNNVYSSAKSEYMVVWDGGVEDTLDKKKHRFRSLLEDGSEFKGYIKKGYIYKESTNEKYNGYFISTSKKKYKVKKGKVYLEGKGWFGSDKRYTGSFHLRYKIYDIGEDTEHYKRYRLGVTKGKVTKLYNLKQSYQKLND